MAVISKKSVNAFLRKKGIDPMELWCKDAKKLILKKRQVEIIQARLNADKMVVVRITKKGRNLEFVNLRYVTVQPRFNFERPGFAESLNDKIGIESHA